MRPRRARNCLPIALVIWLLQSISGRSAEEAGLFEGQSEVGRPTQAGSVIFDPGSASYVCKGGGENMWFTNDSFHFVWKRVSGDFSLRAAVEWMGTGGNAHRKACLVVRQNLSPDSPYIDVAVHGDGLTSLQFRETAGGGTREIQATQKGPPRVGISRQGNTFFMTADPEKLGLAPTGAFMRLQFSDPVYVGLGVCAHDDKVLETARFSKVELVHQDSPKTNQLGLHCALETISIASKDRRVVYHTTNLIEAPNWSRDGSYLLFNSKGRIYRLPAKGGTTGGIDTGFAERCNNDHGISPDGFRLVISDQTRGGKSLIYTLPVDGGDPKRITALGPSYWHGWSPDGLSLVYCAERNGDFDVYTISADGAGEERQLTTAKGLDDGPDYTADGKWIYFNSERSGSMQIWRMKPDGSDQQAVTSDNYNNWFPHPSPDGKLLVFLSYEKGVSGHPANQPVKLRIMPLSGGPAQELAHLFGGQGTINVPSWSPDSRQLAFVSYELIRR